MRPRQNPDPGIMTLLPTSVVADGHPSPNLQVDQRRPRRLVDPDLRTLRQACLIVEIDDLMLWNYRP